MHHISMKKTNINPMSLLSESHLAAEIIEADQYTN